MTARRAIIVGAGAGGLAAAVDLARAGFSVDVLERAERAGGKIRQITVGGRGIDAGPTVFTMRWIFEQLFEDAGARLDEALTLHRADVLARHAWTSGGALDLYADRDRSAEAIRAFAGREDAEGYLGYCAMGADIYRTLREPFIGDQRPSLVDLVARVGLRGIPGLVRTKPLSTLWAELGRRFRDPRLRQLFGRYATYVGSSPFRAMATLSLIAHVEQEGVWYVDGGMAAVADALRDLGEQQGAHFRFGAHVRSIDIDRGRVVGVTTDDGESLAADVVIFNGDVAALGDGLLGPSAAPAGATVARRARSLSATTWCALARPRGFGLVHHNVFFAPDYAREFQAVLKDRRTADDPTVYICAQDRRDGPPTQEDERLLVLVNAPADGDLRTDGAVCEGETIETVANKAMRVLNRCGLELDLVGGPVTATTPAGFDALFPGTGGALYGRLSHGMNASLGRPAARTRIRGLYLAGGSVHPGAGVPMATMSGRLAAAAVLGDVRP